MGACGAGMERTKRAGRMSRNCMLIAEALTRDWSFGLAADRYVAWHCSCSDHADVLHSGLRL